MKRVLIILLLAFPLLAECAPSRVGHATGVGANGGTTSVVTTTGATLFVVSPGYSTGTPITVSDHCSNVWSSVAASVLAGVVSERIYYVVNPSLCANETFTVACTSCYMSFEAEAWSGAYALKNSAAAQNSGNNNTPVGPITTTVGDLVISGIGTGGTFTFTVGSPFTLGDYVQTAGGNNYGSQIATGIATGTSTSLTWANAAGGIQGATTLVSFSAIPAAHGPTSQGSFF